MATGYEQARLVIFDADGTTVDAFAAIEQTFAAHGMDLGDLVRFQKRRKLFKYIGGFKEFPRNLRRQLGLRRREQLLQTLTEVYRQEARMFEALPQLLRQLTEAPGVRVGVVTRNITLEPLETLRQLFQRHDVPVDALDFLLHLPLNQEKTASFHGLRERFALNPAWCYACGDEAKDFKAAVGAGMHPFMVSYGFEGRDRLIRKSGVPEAVIAHSPRELAARLRHTLQLPEPESEPQAE